jgi:hypothetical protein
MRDGELARLRGDALERFPAAPDAKQGSVMGVAADADGSVWAAVRQGLIRLVGKERKLLGVRNGLPCEFYYGLVQDNHGAVWMYGQCGLVSIARAELMKWWARPDTVVQVNLFDMLDGAEPGMATFQPSATKTPDGRLWFANDRVVQMIDPDRLQKNGKPPPVHIERVVADRREYAPQQDLVLPALTRDLEIDYTALSFAAPQKVRFRYQLEGRDSNWQDPETRRQAFYTDLRPGPYTFRVIACNRTASGMRAARCCDSALPRRGIRRIGSARWRSSSRSSSRGRFTDCACARSAAISARALMSVWPSARASRASSTTSSPTRSAW